MKSQANDQEVKSQTKRSPKADTQVDSTTSASEQSGDQEFVEQAGQQMQKIVADTGDVATEVFNYARQNPAEVAGMAVTGLACLWFATQTVPGRRLVQAGKPMVVDWISKKFGQVSNTTETAAGSKENSF